MEDEMNDELLLDIYGNVDAILINADFVYNINKSNNRLDIINKLKYNVINEYNVIKIGYFISDNYLKSNYNNDMASFNADINKLNADLLDTGIIRYISIKKGNGRLVKNLDRSVFNFIASSYVKYKNLMFVATNLQSGVEFIEGYSVLNKALMVLHQPCQNLPKIGYKYKGTSTK